MCMLMIFNTQRQRNDADCLPSNSSACALMGVVDERWLLPDPITRCPCHMSHVHVLFYFVAALNTSRIYSKLSLIRKFESKMVY